MMNKSCFIIIYDQQQKILLIKKKSLGRWEIPRAQMNEGETIYSSVENYLKNNFCFDYKIIGVSDVIDKYEWPKELATITGKSGEEHRFIFLILKDKIDNNSIKSHDIEGYDFADFNNVYERVIFKNHRQVLRKVFSDLQQKINPHQQKKESLDYDEEESEEL